MSDSGRGRIDKAGAEQNMIRSKNTQHGGQRISSTEELTSMEEDMDFCNTPPHVSVIADTATGKWYYLDHFNVERGPSKLSDLKTLVEEGYLVFDHLIKHFDSDRWVTLENAISPLDNHIGQPLLQHG
ncbi:histone H3 (Lys4) methyltransferase complex [Forsythia ovata]|uniref:Histone H3 (Lys4) methyltransferase complex n=1 Tax=Forsythia ovata TaxID=205694 RepID=A0ABD1TQQ6_9LAMI